MNWLYLSNALPVAEREFAQVLIIIINSCNKKCQQAQANIDTIPFWN